VVKIRVGVLTGGASAERDISLATGAQIAASSNVRGDVPPGVRWGGTPAKPLRLWFRELTLLRKLAERKDLTLDQGEGSSHTGEEPTLSREPRGAGPDE